MAAKKPETALYFNELTAFDVGSVFIGGHLYSFDDSDTKLTRVMRFRDGDWGFTADLDGIASGMGAEMKPKPRYYVLLREGEVHSFTSDGQETEEIDLDDNGYLFDLRKIGERWYACGSQHMVFRRQGREWAHMDDGVFVPVKKTVDRQFFAIDGTAEDDIYCVGAGGAIAHYDGKRWTMLESPTNYDLWCVRCRSKDEVFVAGNNGVMFAGSRNGWRRLGDAGYEGVFTSLEDFQGILYAAADSDLWRWDGRTLELVDTGLEGDVAFYKLCAAGAHLWATSGQEEIYHFDGKSWEELVCPENQPTR